MRNRTKTKIDEQKEFEKKQCESPSSESNWCDAWYIDKLKEFSVKRTDDRYIIEVTGNSLSGAYTGW